MTLTISHPDQVYVLQEALEAFAKTVKPSQWRATVAAEELLAQLERLAQPE